MFGINFNFAAQYNAAKNCGPFCQIKVVQNSRKCQSCRNQCPRIQCKRKRHFLFLFIFSWFGFLVYLAC